MYGRSDRATQRVLRSMGAYIGVWEIELSSVGGVGVEVLGQWVGSERPDL
jgi:hypothetical protein